MKKNFLLLTVALLAIAQGAWAQFEGGTGTSKDPYIISSTAHWDYLVSTVADGNTYQYKHVKLTADITVTTMVSTSHSYPFEGYFDGGGHTLTVHYGSEAAPVAANFCAPFRFGNSATIYDLHVAGYIYTSAQYAAGIAAFLEGESNIENCRVSVAINSSFDGDGILGGLVAKTNVSNSITTIKDCVFDGSMTGSSNTKGWGGIVGLRGDNTFNHIYLTRCLFAPSSLTLSDDESATFSRGNEKFIGIEDCYYITPLGDVQGTKAYASEPTDFPSTKKSIGGVDFYVKKVVVNDFTVTDLTHNSATIGWTSSEGCSNYTLRYRLAGSNDDWTTIGNATRTGTNVSGLQPETTYEYQVGYKYSGNYYYTSSQTFTTWPQPDIVSSDFSVSNVTYTSAVLSWTGTAETYNLRYRSYIGTTAKVTLSVPNKVWNDESGYQMLLDADHNTFGTIIPQNGSLTHGNPASEATYANFEKKIPENADGYLTTKNVVDGNKCKSVTIEISAGIYDWCIVNPTPAASIFIAKKGNIDGRQDNFRFEPGMHYVFTVTKKDGKDRVDLTVSDLRDKGAEEDFGGWTNMEGISTTSKTLNSLKPNKYYEVQVQPAVKGDTQSEWSTLGFTTPAYKLTDDADNSTLISDILGRSIDIPLAGRTLYMDGSWNTLCLPFKLSADQLANADCPLYGATIKTLSSSEYNSTTGTLTLTFSEDLTEMEAGKPYLVKWTTTGGELEDPTFQNVTINNTHADVTTDCVDFVGSFSPVSLTAGDRSVLYLGAGNKLYYPSNEMTVGSFRAVFQLKGIEAGDLAQQARAIVLNFGDDETTGIREVKEVREVKDNSWYSLDGRRLTGKPSRAGVYINNGKKIVIK